MTLSSEIAALTGDESFATLIKIDARVATLLNPVFTPPQDIPYYATDIRATLAEIRRRGWLYQMSNCLGEPQNYRLHFNLMTHENSNIYGVERADRDEALAALEALVLALEGQG